MGAVACRALMVAAVLVSVSAASARAGDDGGGGSGVSGPFAFAYAQPGEPEQKPAPEAVTKSAAEFGAPDSQWWTVGGDVSYGFNGSTDIAAHGSYSFFMARDVEFAAELGLWHFNQPGDNAEGLSVSMVFRWHFINTGAWTVYADAGIGVLGATDDVPDGGTSFDLMPRAGVGFTRLLSDDGVRLQVGLRWHHISNARIFGDGDNPARDQPLVYAGIIFPF